MATIDAHLHAWSSMHAYAPGKEPPSALGDEVASAEALLATMQRCGVRGALVVQPINYGFDHTYVLEVLAANPKSFKGMLLANPTLPPAEAVAELRSLAAAGFAGARFNPYLWPEASRNGEWLADPTGSALFAASGELGLPVGLMAFGGLTPLAPSLRTLMAASPATLVVLDHWGFPRADPAAAPAGQQIDEAAWRLVLELGERYPQVHIKVSALFRVSGSDAPHADLRPRFDELLRAYGPQRLMWGSDFPFVTQQAGGYDASLDAARVMVSKLSTQDAEQILGGTAARLFGFDL